MVTITQLGHRRKRQLIFADNQHKIKWNLRGFLCRGNYSRSDRSPHLKDWDNDIACWGNTLIERRQVQPQGCTIGSEEQMEGKICSMYCCKDKKWICPPLSKTILQSFAAFFTLAFSGTQHTALAWNTIMGAAVDILSVKLKFHRQIHGKIIHDQEQICYGTNNGTKTLPLCSRTTRFGDTQVTLAAASPTPSSLTGTWSRKDRTGSVAWLSDEGPCTYQIPTEGFCDSLESPAINSPYVAHLRFMNLVSDFDVTQCNPQPLQHPRDATVIKQDRK